LRRALAKRGRHRRPAIGAERFFQHLAHARSAATPRVRDGRVLRVL
jgi:hypothetical protein